MRRFFPFLLLAVLTLQGESKLLSQKPTLSATKIAFVYAGISGTSAVTAAWRNGSRLEPKPNCCPTPHLMVLRSPSRAGTMATSMFVVPA